MPKKSKPKQRTNWKQRALHCEEVIGVQNELAKAAEARMSRYIYSAAEAIKRAESAEKHNALLLEERQGKDYLISNSCQICGKERTETLLTYTCYSAKCLRACADKLDSIASNSARATRNDPVTVELTHHRDGILTPPTHWQRCKSFLTNWEVELLTVAVVLTVLSAYVAFIYRKG